MIQKSAAWSLAMASIMPPPFPFTAFVAAAAAFQYPRRKLLTVIAAARFVRFFLVGISAIMFGKSILQIAYGPVVRYLIIALFIATILGSVISVRARIKAIRFRYAQDSQTAEGLA